jgi:hypothetical protein
MPKLDIDCENSPKKQHLDLAPMATNINV